MAGGYQPRPRIHMEHHLPITTDNKVTMDDRSQPRASMEPHLLLPWIRRCHWQQITAQDTERHWVSITTDKKVPMANRPQFRTLRDISFPLLWTRMNQCPKKAQLRTSSDPHLSAIKDKDMSVAARSQPGARTACYHGLECVSGIRS